MSPTSRLSRTLRQIAWSLRPVSKDPPNRTDSARRHGVNDEDIPDAHRNPVRIIDLPDDNLTMLIGPDRAARLLEIGVSSVDGIEFVIHAMPAGDKYLK
jgi:hypothetical protein